MFISVLLGFYVITGMPGPFTGAASLAVQKGTYFHRVFGTAFFLSMLGMTASSVFLALIHEQLDNVLVGAFTFYLVVTAWLTVTRKERQAGVGEKIALIGVLLIISLALRFAWEAAHSPIGLKDGVAADNFYVISAIAACFAGFDIKLVLSGGVAGAQRIARHLWRMCFAMFIATLSLVVQTAAIISGPTA
ncbi:MAG: hypothetical protein AAF512_15090 [Pseudomonadota bacterium]